MYQNRFWSHALDDPEHLVVTCRYVERNALAARLVRRAEDWPWSSLSERINPDSNMPVVCTPFLISEAWLDYVNTPRPRDDQAHAVFHNLKPVPLSVENSDDLAEHPGVVVEQSEQIGRTVGGTDQNESHAHVERAKHLGVVEVAGMLEPAENRGHGPALAVE